ncbi:MAG: hypothetical protein J6252_04265, partial [Clostridia bacterium]|nr:hypothetical protein [Clostridia bacterium]
EYCGSVSAFCGTRIIKPGDRDFGMASCLFFDGDFRMVRAVEKDIYEDADPASQTDIEALVSGAEEVASAAAKLAEAKPLTNEEEKLCLRYYGMGAASSARNPFTATIIVYLLIVAVEFIGVFAVSGLLALLTQDASVFAVLKNTLAWLFIVPAIVLAAIFGIYYGFNLFVRIRNKQKGKKKKPAE